MFHHLFNDPFGGCIHSLSRTTHGRVVSGLHILIFPLKLRNSRISSLVSVKGTLFKIKVQNNNINQNT